MYAISVGYPLEIKDNNSKIEIDNDIQIIDHNEAAVWISFNGIKKVGDMNGEEQIFERLTSIGALKRASSLPLLLEQIYDVVLMRQGAGIVKEGKNLVYLGDREIVLSEPSYMIWKVSDGITSVKDIFLFLNQEYGVDENTFMYCLSGLDERDLIFLI